MKNKIIFYFAFLQMDKLFSTEIDTLIECLTAMKRTCSISLVKRAQRAAMKIDLIYNVMVHGFEKENQRISEDIYDIAIRLMEELEEKELLIQECKDILAPSSEIDVNDVLSYSKLLGRHSKCPLLWTEDTGLERLPAYPTDSLIQQSLLRAKQMMDDINN
ncbi:uncharacterized protein NESG_01147 [Nematocida ausubeli]|uniref:Uncharacterized protein n=1 Tax=Nematocida ausubeli (strain ATCC PRA-371 / ERTm2) TaxID=1913371 RepID=A0A086J1L7_NEMA1|nr:uncharacterized protein NESG_01147 [Nematocida ausubeli]KAI5136010.1 hypothetical protein NEAUS07_1418 [Nematocida ausubeli]KAI5147844.1 hypothetical protein NEAUS05_1125 [Nematocida ausubeli]KFG26035.1 hypothetical protein NESG_01147 [Nematocida ausubeli]